MCWELMRWSGKMRGIWGKPFPHCICILEYNKTLKWAVLGNWAFWMVFVSLLAVSCHSVPLSACPLLATPVRPPHPPTPTLSIKTPLFVFNLCVMEAPDRQCAPNILDSFLIPDYPLLIPRLRSQSFHLICWDLFAVFGFVLLRSDFLCILFSLNCIQNKCCRLWHGRIYLFKHAHPADTSTDCTTQP